MAEVPLYLVDYLDSEETIAAFLKAARKCGQPDRISAAKELASLARKRLLLRSSC